MNTDPIADMLTRIRNAASARRDSLSMPYSKMKEQIARILKDNGYIANYKVNESGTFKALEVELIDPEAGQSFTAINRVSKPGRRIYAGVEDIPAVLGGRGIVIVSTSAGVMTGREARRKGLGGELICKVW